MIKYFCDSCKKEANSLYSFRYLTHLEKPMGGYIKIQLDGSIEDVSGREEVRELCLKCYNEIMRGSVSMFLMRRDKS
jgi:hypothetical protein